MLSRQAIKKLIPPLILLMVILSVPYPVSAEENSDSTYDIFYFMEIMDIIQENYVYGIKKEDLIKGAIKGLFYNLDPHSQYYTKEEFQELVELTSGNFVGIGVYVTEEKGYVKITDIIEGGPAHRMGMKPGDVILEVDGQDVDGLSMEEVTALIRGEAGTYVKLKIRRNDNVIVYNIRRELVEVNPVEYSFINNNIAYIQIREFNEHTTENLEKALKNIDKKRIKNIIVDLRNNPGGLLVEATGALEFFVPQGPLVHIRYKGGGEETLYSHLKEPKYNLAVLVNEYSASASEIFAGAVQDTGVGKIIGTTTYGKGTVQLMLSLPLGDGMKITVAEYLTPNRRNINQTGIQPDIVVENKGMAEDMQLRKAIEYFNEMENYKG
ncbi:MAG TPA: S41 family peptidase [Tissierellia bacterium]|nr:S41 family peptidase [Tissierellia bacterium]